MVNNLKKLQSMLRSYYYYLEQLSLSYYQRGKYNECLMVDNMLSKFEEFFHTQGE